MKLKFQIEQIALYPRDPEAAKDLLTAIGAGPWAEDEVQATGIVFGERGNNKANLNFEYELSGHGKELEVLEYTDGPNWMDGRDGADPFRVSHLGMHCDERELAAWRAFFDRCGIAVAQEVSTKQHTNPVIAGKRWYTYVIFDTYKILGVDLKFIVRRDQPDL